MEFMPISETKASLMVEETYINNIDSIIDLILSLKLNLTINLRDLKLLTEIELDKSINFCVKISDTHQIMIQKLYKKYKISDYFYSNRTSDGDLICYRFDQEDTMIRTLILKDFYQTGATDEFGNKGVYFYKDHILYQTIPKNIVVLRLQYEQSKEVVKKYML